jgi:hypothetical protein
VNKKLPIALSLFALTAFGLMACDNNDDTPADVPTSVWISPSPSVSVSPSVSASEKIIVVPSASKSVKVVPSASVSVSVSPSAVSRGHRIG